MLDERATYAEVTQSRRASRLSKAPNGSERAIVNETPMKCERASHGETPKGSYWAHKNGFIERTLINTFKLIGGFENVEVEVKDYGEHTRFGTDLVVTATKVKQPRQPEILLDIWDEEKSAEALAPGHTFLKEANGQAEVEQEEDATEAKEIIVYAGALEEHTPEATETANPTAQAEAEEDTDPVGTLVVDITETASRGQSSIR